MSGIVRGMPLPTVVRGLVAGNLADAAASWVLTYCQERNSDQAPDLACRHVDVACLSNLVEQANFRLVLDRLGWGEAYLWSTGIFLKRPNAPATRPHQDAVFWPDSLSYSMSVWIALTTVGPDDAPLVFRLSTGDQRVAHTRVGHGDSIPEDQVRSLPTVWWTMRPGDALLFNGWHVHESNAIRTPSSRVAFCLRLMPVHPPPLALQSSRLGYRVVRLS